MISEIKLWLGVLIENERLKASERAWSHTTYRTEFSTTELEALLIVGGAVHPPERRGPEDRRKGDDSEDDEDEEDLDRSSRMRSAATSTNGRTKKNVRGKENDSDSDFDFDL